MRLDQGEIIPVADRTTKMLSLLLLRMWKCIQWDYLLTHDQCKTRIHSGLWFPNDSFHYLLGRAPVFQQLTAALIWHTRKNTLTGGWMSWTVLPTHYGHTSYFTALHRCTSIFYNGIQKTAYKVRKAYNIYQPKMKASMRYLCDAQPNL